MRIYIKKALTTLACAAMVVFSFTGCQKESAEKNELKGTQWIAVEESTDEEFSGIDLSITYNLTFDKKAIFTANVLWLKVPISFSYDYEKPIATFTDGKLVIDDDSSWTALAEMLETSLQELLDELKDITFTAIVNGDKLTLLKEGDDFFDGDGIVFTKIK